MGKFLLVEDNTSWLQTLKAIIEMAGHKAFTAKNAEEGISLFKKNTIDVIISDLRMPGMNGDELLKEVRRMDTYVGFILMSAYATTDEVVQFKPPYLDKFIEKPVIDLRAFISLIEEVLERALKRKKREKGIRHSAN